MKTWINKNKSFLIVASLLWMVALCGCEKESCVTCTLTEYPTNISNSQAFCGTDSEIATEDAKWKNQATLGTTQNPGYTYTGGCD